MTVSHPLSPRREEEVVPSNASFPPIASGEVSVVSSMQVPPAPISGYPSGVEQGVIGTRPIVAAAGLKTPDLGVFTDIRPMGGLDDTPCTRFFPNPLSTAEAQALEALDQHALHVYDDDAVGPNAEAVLGHALVPLGSLKKGSMSTRSIFPPEI